MSRKVTSSIVQEQKFFYSFLGALVGVGLIGYSVYLGAKDDFVATLLIQGGNFLEYTIGLGIAILFIGGIALIARHIIHEDSTRRYCEKVPY